MIKIPKKPAFGERGMQEESVPGACQLYNTVISRIQIVCFFLITSYSAN